MPKTKILEARQLTVLWPGMVILMCSGIGYDRSLNCLIEYKEQGILQDSCLFGLGSGDNCQK